MAIATLLIATLILKFTGAEGAAGMSAAIAIGSIICIVSAIAGDTSQDLKTGYILGSTPKKQQIGELIGVVASALAIGGTLYLLDAAWGFGGDELAAPQATLMKMIVEGVMNAELPWNLVIIGALIAVVVDVSLIFSHLQNAESGEFDVTGLRVEQFADSFWLPVVLVSAICAVICAALLVVRARLLRKAAEERETP